jgi:hypothetical protein
MLGELLLECLLWVAEALVEGLFEILRPSRSDDDTER